MRRRPLRFLLSPWPLRCYVYLLSGALFGLAVLLTLAVLVVVGLVLCVAGVGLLVLAATATAGLPVAQVEHMRLRLVEPAPLPAPHDALAGAGAGRWLRTRLRERATWRELGYTALLVVFFTWAGLAIVALLTFTAALVATPVIVWAVAPDTVMLIPGRAIPGPAAALPFSVAGLLGLAFGGYLAGLLAGAQVRTAWFLLSARDDETDRRVMELTRSRVRLADAFEAERRRIERDLHDGAQQQLVALTMTLGLAQMELEDGSPAAELLSRGRAEARRALDQLRDLIRGIHPQVLTDHGLAAAVTEVAMRNPIPVVVDIALPGRLPGPVETVAYFTVTEALANASKHSDASRITITGRLANERLILSVTDDGRGGADPTAGTGLSGLADRLAVLQGRLLVASPAGGPTQLLVEVPCSA